MARIQIYKNALNPDNNYAVIRFENAIVASINDYFIIRKYSPLVTIGGGKVVDFNVLKNGKIIRNICKVYLKQKIIMIDYRL